MGRPNDTRSREAGHTRPAEVRGDKSAKEFATLQSRTEESAMSGAKSQSELLEDIVHQRTDELRASEEMFRELAANIPEALSIRDVSRQSIQYVNAAWQS